MGKYKKRCTNFNKFGVIVASIGVGIVIAVVIPFWGWLLVIGGGLIYAGWYLLEHRH